MRNILLVICCLIGFSISVNAQNKVSSTAKDLRLEIELNNPSKTINDATASIKVIGGQPPYKYKWLKIYLNLLSFSSLNHNVDSSWDLQKFYLLHL